LSRNLKKRKPPGDWRKLLKKARATQDCRADDDDDDDDEVMMMMIYKPITE
jgi:hypothetical protein